MEERLAHLGLEDPLPARETVELDDIDVVRLQSAEARLHVPDHGFLRTRSRADLRGHVDLVPDPLDCLCDDLLVAAAHVGPGRVDVVDPVIEGGADHLRLGRQHGAEAHDGDLQPRPAQGPVNGGREG